MGIEAILERLQTPATSADSRYEATTFAEEVSGILRELVVERRRYTEISSLTRPFRGDTAEG